MTTRRKPTPLQLFTQNQLAARFNRDRRTTAKLLEHVQPAKVTGRWRYYRLADVADLLKDVAPRGASQSKKDQLADEQIRKHRLANDAREGTLIPRAEVCRVHTDIIESLKRKLQQALVYEYPTEVATERREIDIARGFGRRLYDELLEDLSRLGDAWENF